MEREYSDIGYLRRYVDGELSAQEMYAVERAAHRDEMLMDVLMGLEYEKSHHLPRDLEDLRHRIQKRVAEQSVKKQIPWSTWAVAASVLLVAVWGGLYLIQSNGDRASQQIGEELVRRGDTTTTRVEPGDASASDTDAKIALADTETSSSTTPPTQPRVTPTDRVAKTKPKPAPKTEPQKEVLSEIVFADTGMRTTIDRSAELLAHRDTFVLAEQHAVIKPLDDASWIRGIGRAHKDSQTNMILTHAQNKPEGAVVDDDLFIRGVPTHSKTRPVAYKHIMRVREPSEQGEPANQQVDRQQVSRRVQVEITAAPERVQVKSEPTGGWDKLDAHIANVVREHALHGGYVRLTFRLDTDGVPQDIEVMESSQPDLDALFVETLREGPAWKRGSDAAKVILMLAY